MGLSDIVVVDVSISNSSSPTVQGLSTGALIGYHSHYPDRLRVYSTATMLASMVTDGFKTYEPLYRMAQRYAAAPNAPALCAIGRRALAPFQTLKLTCTDGTVGDAYSFHGHRQHRQEHADRVHERRLSGCSHPRRERLRHHGHGRAGLPERHPLGPQLPPRRPLPRVLEPTQRVVHGPDHDRLLDGARPLEPLHGRQRFGPDRDRGRHHGARRRFHERYVLGESVPRRRRPP